jgi:heat shock protein HtpX
MKRIFLFVVTNLAVSSGLLRSMIAALEALKRSQGEPMPPQMQAFGINTGGGSGFMRLFMSHPPLDERIAALQSF